MKNKKLPMPPQVVAGVIKAAADPEANVNDLAKLIKMDAVLSAQIIKAVNSAFYGTRSKILTVERAVAFLGIRAVRNLVLCFGVKELAPRQDNYPLDAFWEGSLRRATAAKCLASRQGQIDEEELFTTGLCQDIGVLLLLGDGSPEAVEAMAASADDFSDARRETERRFGKTHDEIGGELFSAWDFPLEIVDPIRFHHDPEKGQDGVDRRARILLAAETVADLFQVEDKHRALQLLTASLETLGIQKEDLWSLLKEVGESVTLASAALGLKVGPQPSYEEIAAQASEGLLELHQSYQKMTSSLEDSLKEQERTAAHLREMNKELEHLILTDPLTKLPNRRAYDEGFEVELERARRLGKPVALLLLDLDEFKKVNDGFGHLAGDHVLKEVANVIKASARACDIPARFGGEEFVLILPHTDLDGAVIAAERLRQNVESAKIEFDGTLFNITVSIGVTLVENPEELRAAVLALRRADDAMYEAKDAGRNQVKIN